jgi:uncharacterized surface protein with fasciclin (FAS1) repeats
MNLKSRILRIAFALVLAAAVAMQIPSRTGVAVADDSYAGSGGGGGRTLIQATVFGLVAYGIYATVTGQGVPGPEATIPGEGTGTGEEPPAQPGPGDPIWDVTNKTDDLKQFATTSETAGLKDTLRKAGQYTAFVPTNNAFGALDPQVLQDLMKEENKAKLADIIGFHVIQGSFTIEQLKTEATKAGTDGFKTTTITGKTLVITNDGNLKVNGVTIAESDLPATNGMIHPVASVLMPSE